MSRHDPERDSQPDREGASPSPSYVVVGSCIMDFCVSVARLPERGETVLAHGLARSLGGKGANQATALRRLGGDVALVTCLGSDDFGQAFLTFFEQEGIETGFVQGEPSAPTGVAFPMILPGGANAIVVAPAASLRLSVAAVELAAPRIRAATALLLQLEIPAAAAAAAMSLAREAGVPVFLNPAPCVPEARELVRGAGVLIPNQVEAEALMGTSIHTLEDALQAADRLRSLGPEVVIVTMGESGAALSAPGIQRLVPAYRVDTVDPTGAGDAFCAGLVDAHCRGASWPEAADFACACGALACRGSGAIPWLPTRADVRTLVARDGRGLGPLGLS